MSANVGSASWQVDGMAGRMVGSWQRKVCGFFGNEKWQMADADRIDLFSKCQ